MSEGNFEAKVSAKRETSAGIFLTLQIQPDDYQSELATLRVGSALVIGWAEVVDVKAEPITISPVAQRTEQQTSNLKAEGSNPSGATKDRKPFASLPLSQQAALRCRDEMFFSFLKDRKLLVAHDAAETVRQYCGVTSRGLLDDPQQGRARAAWDRLDSGFQAYLTDRQFAEARR